MKKRSTRDILSVAAAAPRITKSTEPIAVHTDKKRSISTWRDVLSDLSQQQIKREARSFSQDQGQIAIETDRPICILTLSDTHIGSWATDYKLFEAMTQEIIDTPEFFVILLGDLLNMAIKLRSVAEIHDDALTPGDQFDVLESWLGDIGHKVLAATWDNHAVEREEKQAGSSTMARILSRRVIYHKGIGHLDIAVGEQVYKVAVSHHFQGTSIYNPVHGAQRYLIMQAPDREIAACGDSHVPGALNFMHNGAPRLAINTGSIQTNSVYAKRYFSLSTAPIFPCFTLDPREHRVVSYWSPGHYLAASR